MKTTRWLFVLAVSSTLALAAEADFAFPLEWRSWQHVKSMVIADKAHPLHGFHHVYVHQKALAAYKKGGGYAEGVTMAVPFYEVNEGGGATTEGALLKVLFMKKDKAATSTGGWRFAAFDGTGKRLELDAKTACFNCHEPRKARDFVFSEWPAP